MLSRKEPQWDYLSQPAEYAAYGLAPETADELVTMASALMEGALPAARRSWPRSMLSEFAWQSGNADRKAQLRAVARLPQFTAVRVRFGASTRRRFRGASERTSSSDLKSRNAFGLPGSRGRSLDPANGGCLCRPRVRFHSRLNLLGLAYNEAEITYTAGFTNSS